MPSLREEILFVETGVLDCPFDIKKSGSILNVGVSTILASL